MATFTGPVPKGLDFNTALAAERDRQRSRQLQRRLSDSFVRYVIIIYTHINVNIVAYIVKLTIGRSGPVSMYDASPSPEASRQHFGGMT